MENIKQKEIYIKENGFDYGERHYDCHYAIERDMKMILQEAETSHKDNFDEFYDRNTLQPSKIRIFFNENGMPIFGMVLYVIYQRDGYWRSACGGYYTFIEENLFPHPYQESICW